MSNYIATQMTEPEARLLVDEIKSGINKVSQKLLELYEREGWRALGYPSWRDCIMTEFDFQKTHVYELLNFARVEQNLSAIGGKYPLPKNERQARPLASLSPEEQLEAWPLVIESTPDGKEPTAAHVGSVVKNYLRDNRRMVAADIYIPKKLDACQTPAYALDPLLPYLPREWTIWEPAAGEGYLADALFDSGFSQVIATDLLRQENFFEFDPDRWDAIITNPPYSIVLVWLERCYELGKPFALLLKVDVLGNKGSQELFDRYGIEVILLNKRISFKMPVKGWDSNPPFSTAWFTYGLNIGRQLTFGKVKTDGD